MELTISNSSKKPIYEQITSQIKAMIVLRELSTGDALPSMKSLAKSIHVCVITVQRAYEDLQRDGLIVVPTHNKEYARRTTTKSEEYLIQAVDIAQTNKIATQKLVDIMYLFYQGET